MSTVIGDAKATESQPSSATFQGRPLRVLMLTDCFPKPSNQTLGVWALAQARGLVQAGAEVRVVSPTPWLPKLLAFHPKVKRMTDCPATFDWGEFLAEYPRWPYYNVPIHQLQKNPNAVLGFAQFFLRSHLRRTIQSWKPDVVFLHHTVPAAPVAVWIKKTFGIPFITQDHDFGAIENARVYPSRRKVFAEAAAQAHSMTAVAKRITDSMAQQFPARLNVPLYMGTAAVDAGLGSNPRPVEWADKLVVFSAAGFFERKAIPDLVRSFAIVAKKRSDVILRLGGDGPFKPQVLAAITESGVSDRIHLLGSLSHDQVMQEMVWSDLFMLIGWAEPFAIVYLEAMSAGKPIICCNDGGICEVMTDGREGRAVPPHDVSAAAAALEQLLSDDALRRQMGQAAYELFERRLNIKSTALETLSLLHAAASQTDHR